jgi:hypothetical protein
MKLRDGLEAHGHRGFGGIGDGWLRSVQAGLGSRVRYE